MKLGFNEATALKCKNTTLERDLALCEKYGYDYIEIRTEDCLRDYLTRHSINELAEYFAAHHVKPLAFNTLLFFNNRTLLGQDEVIAELKRMCEWGKLIGCNTIITVPAENLEKTTRSAIRSSATKMLAEMGKIAEASNMRIGLEFLGHPENSINTFREAWSIVEEINKDNIGIVLDCFQFHGMNSGIADLASADGRKIFIIHLDDSEDFQFGALKEEDRIWPGDGCIELDAIMQTLRKIGYRENVLSLELFRPEYYKMDADDVFRIGREKCRKIIERNF